MSSSAYYMSPQSLLISMIIFALFAILTLAETVALMRVPRIAGQRGWRQWLAVLPGLASLAFSAIAGILIYVYSVLSSDPTYTPSSFSNCVAIGNGATCAPQELDARALQAINLYLWVNTFELYAVIGLFVILLFGFIVLAIGSRRRVTIAPVAS